MIARRREKVASLYIQGRSQFEIGMAVGVSQSTVCGDMKVVMAEWEERAIQTYDKIVTRELAKLDELERQYWEAWHRSVGKVRDFVHEKKSVELAVGEPDEHQEPQPHGGSLKRNEGPVLPAIERKRRVNTKHLAGNPAFLDGVMKCIERRCHILGVDAPKKVQGLFGVVNNQPGGNNADAPTMSDLAGKTDAELAAIYRTALTAPGSAIRLADGEDGGDRAVPALPAPAV